MGREKQGYRDTMVQLNEMFPDKGMLTRADVVRFTGKSLSTVCRHIKFKGNIVTKADLARQVCL